MSFLALFLFIYLAFMSVNIWNADAIQLYFNKNMDSIRYVGRSQKQIWWILNLAKSAKFKQ